MSDPLLAILDGSGHGWLLMLQKSMIGCQMYYLNCELKHLTVARTTRCSTKDGVRRGSERVRGCPDDAMPDEIEDARREEGVLGGCHGQVMSNERFERSFRAAGDPAGSLASDERLRVACCCHNNLHMIIQWVSSTTRWTED